MLRQTHYFLEEIGYETSFHNAEELIEIAQRHQLETNKDGQHIIDIDRAIKYFNENAFSIIATQNYMRTEHAERLLNILKAIKNGEVTKVELFDSTYTIEDVGMEYIDYVISHLEDLIDETRPHANLVVRMDTAIKKISNYTTPILTISKDNAPMTVSLNTLYSAISKDVIKVYTERVI